MKKKYKIPVAWSDKIYEVAVSWTETGIIPIEADSLETAIKKAEETVDDIPLPEGEYLDNSFQVDEDTTRILHQMSKGVLKKERKIL